MLRLSAFRIQLSRKSAALLTYPRRNIAAIGLTTVAVGIAGALTLTSKIHLDTPITVESNIVKDSTTDIEFTTDLRIPSRFPLPTYTLLGVGVRRVSFLGVKVYSVGFYADLDSVPPISRSASFDEKIRHIVESSSCVLRIVPTRSTSYGHLRDGFIRAIQARMALQKERGFLTEDDEARIASPLLRFKSMFPNTPLTKHTPLDILLLPQNKNEANEERRLIIRDLGSISNTWLSQEFILAYFEGQGISPPLKHSVEERLQNFGR